MTAESRFAVLRGAGPIRGEMVMWRRGCIRSRPPRHRVRPHGPPGSRTRPLSGCRHAVRGNPEVRAAERICARPNLPSSHTATLRSRYAHRQIQPSYIHPPASRQNGSRRRMPQHTSGSDRAAVPPAARGSVRPAPPTSLDELWRSYKASGDGRLREQLILHYSPLVKYVMRPRQCRPSPTWNRPTSSPPESSD